MSQLPKPDQATAAGEISRRFRPAGVGAPGDAGDDVAALAIFVFGLVDLDFSPARLISGLHQLGWITLMMIPPDPGSSLPLYLSALGETLSIALLGTTHRRDRWRCRSACWRRATSFPRISSAFRCAASSIRSAASIR